MDGVFNYADCCKIEYTLNDDTESIKIEMIDYFDRTLFILECDSRTGRVDCYQNILELSEEELALLLEYIVNKIDKLEKSYIEYLN